MEVNNREWALAIWLATFILFVVLLPASRRSVPGLLRQFFGHRILIPFMIMVVYTSGAVAVLVGFRIWEAKLITPMIIWFLTTALVNFMRVPRAMKEAAFFRKLALSAVAAPVVMQFVVDLYPFGLLEEVLLQGGFILFGALAAYTGKQQGLRPAHHIFNTLVGILAILVVVHSVTEIGSQWTRIDFLGEAKKFLLPIGMTAAFLPFLYVLTLYASFESTLALMKATATKDTKLMKPGLGLAWRTRLSVRRLSEVTPTARFNMARASSVREAITAFDEGREAEAARQQFAADKKQKLIDNAGLDGVDGEGKRLDQREFKETKAALDYLHMCHMGHHRNSGRYRDDMLDVLGEASFRQKGLPHGAVITMHVSEDGQQWWAWHRTTPGWVFAIGAKEAPNDRWEYDGHKVPSGGPGEDPAWRHFMVPAATHEHW
ncbi:hypothetical protein J2Y66_003462 [Paenarthrobacter nitroguajacolicus]|uniref:hypothetical protein n=1 Tax=Paenarthrobacter nitroguajacolicus TaxID=211146 RepID=UPI002860D90B|nr:hypothetical protein [Paenarthrobacter nitroguajacolicus]MDR6988954.1 hypothetical protein [Paenarthrobacter nitroguajacolicus]